MKLLICAIATAVTLLSLSTSTAVALPHLHEAPKELKAGSLLAAPSATLLKSDELQAKISELRAGPHGEEFDRFYEIFEANYVKYYEAFGGAFNDIHGMCEATAGFNATYVKEIRKLATAGGIRWSMEIYIILYSDINENTPMPQVANIINKVITQGAGTVDSFKKSIYRLIEKEDSDALLRAESIYSFAEEIMDVAYNPTIEYLAPFLPTQ